MKVLVINQFASTPVYNTGAGERHFYLASRLGDRGYDFTIISGGVNHLFTKKPVTKKLFNEENIKGGRLIWIKLRNYKPESFIGRAFSWLEFLAKLFFYSGNIKNKPDLVIVSSMSLLPALYAAVIKKRYKIPFILEIRDIWPLTPIEIGGISKHNPFIILFGRLEKFAYSRADSIISVLSHFKDYLSKVMRVDKPVYWIPNAIEYNPVSGYSNSSESHEKDRKFVVAYTGAVGFANAMEYLIRAADILKEYSDIHFLIVGDGPAKALLKDQTKDNPNVTFINKMPKEDVGNLLKEADVGFISWKNINLYKYGIAANKYNDYMLAGLPIISASNITDDPVVLSNCGIQVPSEDEKSIAGAILKLYYMTEIERKSLGENGHNYVIHHNTYKQIAEQYIECIEETLRIFQERINQN